MRKISFTIDPPDSYDLNEYLSSKYELSLCSKDKEHLITSVCDTEDENSGIIYKYNDFYLLSHKLHKDSLILCFGNPFIAPEL